jgi:sensor histidine kinase YesM
LPRTFPLEPTAKSITLLALLLSLIAQTVLVWTGFIYLNKNSQAIEANEKQSLETFFQDNLNTVISEIDNTMDLFEKGDLRKYSTGFLPLRDSATIAQETKELNDKINALHLSPSIYKTVYLIGADSNQLSFRKEVGEPNLHVLADLNKDDFDTQNWTHVFFETSGKIVRFKHDELSSSEQLRTNEEMSDFWSNTAGKLLINNGNIGGIFVIFVLQDDLFKSAEEAQSGAPTSVIVSDMNGEPIWNSMSDPNLAASALKLGSGKLSYRNASYLVTKHQLDLFPYQVTYVDRADGLPAPVLRVVIIFSAIMAIALLLTFGISFIHAKKIFLPFLKFSMAVRRQSLSDELRLKPISLGLFQSGYRDMSLKNKILTIYITSVLVPTLASGLVYSYVLTQSINAASDQYLSRIGELTKTTTTTHIEALESTINRLTISQELQEILTKYQEILMNHNTLTDIPYYKDNEVNYASVAAYPGVNNFSYIVLYDNKGAAIYSSLFSNNMNLFAVNKSLFKDTDAAYWIDDYVDITNRYDAAIVKRIPLLNKALDNGQSYYLLAVPKEDVFKNMDFGPSGFYVNNKQNKELFQLHRYSSNYAAKLFTYSYTIANTGMIATFQYPKEEFVAQYREYFYRFLFVLLGVSLFSLLLANVGSSLLSKPIERLKGSIDDIAKGNFDKLVQGNFKSEIGILIENYNEMVQKINQLIRENMQILEENSQAKLREKEINTLKVKAELDMLQSQINPHFLYNTLEAINMKSIRYGMQDVSAMIRSLAELFRYSVGQGSVMVPLQKEIDHVKNYIAIHNMRIGRMIELLVEVPESLLKASVLRFSLQPIVENSMKYAFAGFMEGASIRITAHSDDRYLYLEIQDNGIGMDEERLEEVLSGLNDGQSGSRIRSNEQTTGIGLRNVHARLQLHFPGNTGITIESELMGGTTVRMSLPLHE